MTKVAIIRCEKNEEKCPLTNCFKCLVEKKEGFSKYDECRPVGVSKQSTENELAIATIELKKALKNFEQAAKAKTLEEKEAAEAFCKEHVHKPEIEAVLKKQDPYYQKLWKFNP